MVYDNEIKSDQIDCFIAQDHIFVIERSIWVPIALVKLVLKLYPVQTQRMQETLHWIHADDQPEGYMGHHPETHEILHKI